MTTEVINAAKALWNFHHLHHQVHQCDCILTLGSHDLGVPEKAAELYLKGFAPLLIMSGGLGNFTRKVWIESEAEKFARIAREKGVPADKILIENQSTNTGENIRFTKKLVAEKGIGLKDIILVQKPYMERRSYATIKKQWPEMEVNVTSPDISFENYPNEEIPVNIVINAMVGDLQRIIIYPDLGYQIPQYVPEEVFEAYQLLIEKGYNEHLIK